MSRTKPTRAPRPRSWQGREEGGKAVAIGMIACSAVSFSSYEPWLISSLQRPQVLSCTNAAHGVVSGSEVCVQRFKLDV